MGNLSTPKSVQKLQTALHAKAKAEAGYRFYALYDKISREDILAHAYAQCRSNKGAPGVDGQDFADIEAYGVQRWLGELALALRQETYRPDPIRRVYIRKANGKLRPLGISTLRDRVCMTAAMLVLEPIFEADLPPEQYALSTAHGISSEVAPQNSPVGGMAISRRRDQHLRLLVAGPAVSGSGEWGSRLPAFCVGSSRGRDQHVRVGDSSSPRFG
ncbi:protein of unknown function [Bradyrhizobium vignae]|uniref:Uncharacterized protein n=1 Tax=Bradyrhizobium vignae TaxID=1549949 RepID=A0A2U3PVE4_9BRAD|nr:protein of unknown function [Bradyrhizobium vignae]